MALAEIRSLHCYPYQILRCGPFEHWTTAAETKQPREKPPAGVKINPDHPLSKGLVCAELFNERT